MSCCSATPECCCSSLLLAEDPARPPLGDAFALALALAFAFADEAPMLELERATRSPYCAIAACRAHAVR
jgi:hypothetical protein